MPAQTPSSPEQRHGRPVRSRAVVGAIALAAVAVAIYAGYIVAVVMRTSG